MKDKVRIYLKIFLLIFYMVCYVFWYMKSPDYDFKYTLFQKQMACFFYLFIDICFLWLGIIFVLDNNKYLKILSKWFIVYQSIVLLYNFYLNTIDLIKFRIALNSFGVALMLSIVVFLCIICIIIELLEL
jgi:hypothetical protein